MSITTRSYSKKRQGKSCPVQNCEYYALCLFDGTNILTKQANQRNDQ